MGSALTWHVFLHDEFDAEFNALPEEVQENLLAAASAVQIAGPKAGRPHVDTLAGSRHSEALFYKRLIKVADARFDRHLARIK